MYIVKCMAYTALLVCPILLLFKLNYTIAKKAIFGCTCSNCFTKLIKKLSLVTEDLGYNICKPAENVAQGIPLISKTNL